MFVPLRVQHLNSNWLWSCSTHALSWAQKRKLEEEADVLPLPECSWDGMGSSAPAQVSTVDPLITLLSQP